MPLSVTQRLALLTQKLADLQYAHGIIDAIPQHQRTASQNMLLQLIDKWTARIISTPLGEFGEFDVYLKQFSKGRTLHNPQGHGDATTGDGDLGKTWQIKTASTTQSGNIDTLLKQALTQISGGTGETPRQGDRRVIELQIYDPHVPWPYGAAQIPPPTEAQLIAAVKGKIDGYLVKLYKDLFVRIGATYKPFTTAEFQQLQNANVGTQYATNPNQLPAYLQGVNVATRQAPSGTSSRFQTNIQMPVPSQNPAQTQLQNVTVELNTLRVRVKWIWGTAVSVPAGPMLQMLGFTHTLGTVSALKFRVDILSGSPTATHVKTTFS